MSYIFPVPRVNKIIAIVILLPGLLLAAYSAGAQQRVLVSPNGDAMILKGSASASEIVRGMASRQLSSLVCTDQGTFGYTRDQYPGTNIPFEAFHQDIMAMWYVAPASGTIDTVFVYNLDVGTLDSTVTVRIFNSNIYPGSGPGYGGYPKPGKLCWGYYISSNDIDNGLAAFPEDATDTTWYSTVTGGTPSFSPMGSEIWGFGGFPKVMNAFATNSIAMAELAPLNVTAGQPFFITIRMYGPHLEQEDDHRTGYYAVPESDSLQTHNWKFYEHIYQGPGFSCPGWVARGDFNFLIWYSMTVTTNLPPAFSNVTRIGNTLSTDPQVVQANILDCDPGTPSQAGVEDAVIRYTLNDVQQPDIPLLYLGGDTWEGTLPAGTAGDRINYRLVAVDSTGFADSTGPTAYRIIGLSSAWYTADTGAACGDNDIRSSGTTVDPASFFVPEYTGSGTFPKDDGTSGPYDMGANFTVFGDTFRYAWIGVNGAVALSKSPTDTLDVNANGFATTQWDLPGTQKSGRTDTSRADDLPGMFIAPFWADMIVGDTSTSYGRIVYGDDGDPCLFVVEWDSLGSFNTLGPLADATTFRVVLNRCTGAVDFQYVNVGTLGLDSAALAGMQADSNEVSGTEPGWIYLNRHATPTETTPRDGWCVRFSPNISTTALDGWNMVSVSLSPKDGNFNKTTIFPAAVSSAYAYAGGYSTSDVLALGKGYWIKFGEAGPVGSWPGSFVDTLSVPVLDKWNMIGGLSTPVATASIGEVGGTTILSPFYGYGSTGYLAATVLEAGKGYWVKVSGAGSLEMNAAAAAPKAAATAQIDTERYNRLTFRDAAGHAGTVYFGEATAGTLHDDGAPDGIFAELPPPPPNGSFDVRFTTQRYIEIYPGAGNAGPREDDNSFEQPISLQGAVSPLSVEWVITAGAPDNRAFVLNGSGSGSTIRRVMEGSGSVVIKDGGFTRFTLGLSGESDVPAEYSLGRNYPNPFNPVTHFTYALPGNGAVSLIVFDLLGREIRTLVDEPMAAGTYTAVWDGKDDAGKLVTTGIYLVRMRAEGFSATRKVVLMK